MKVKNWMLAAALCAVASVGATGLAQAQSDSTGLPAEQQQGDVSFVSGGVGLDESHALRAAAHSWPLALQFTGPGSDYLADVHVSVSDSHGTSVLQSDAQGPYMLLRLHPGRYTVHARYKDQDQSKSVEIAGGGHTAASFHWNEE